MNPADTNSPRLETLAEILSQPDCWQECLRQVASGREVEAARKLGERASEWILIGCGSSYYLAMAAAAAFNHLGLVTRAIPASEVLLYPELHLAKNRQYAPIVISRSGVTSEVLDAMRFLEKERKAKTIAITCAEGAPIESLAAVTLKLAAADEKSMVMTRSFTSILLALQYLAATIAGERKFRDELLRLPAQAAPLMGKYATRLGEFAHSRVFADFAFLAQGPLFGIANESMLKMTEASSSYTQVFHTMEFRHGPKAIAGPGTLITFLLSESSYEAEVGVLREMKELGSPILAVGNTLDERAKWAADFAIELGLDVPEAARAAAYAIWGQLLGVHTGIKKGLNPDAPRNLSRAVILDPQNE